MRIGSFFAGSQPLKDLCEILMRAPGVYGARFSGAGFRGCCVGLVAAPHAEEAAALVEREYRGLQPALAGQLEPGSAVLICEAGDCARVI